MRKYTVWIGGTEANDYLLTYEQAKILSDKYTNEDNYEDVIIEEVLMMKYYMIAITDDYQNMQFTTSVLVKANDFDELNSNINKICSEWYSEDNPVQVDEDGVYSQANGTFTICEGFCEITEDAYNQLKGFIAW